MSESIKITRTLNWLEAKMVNGNCGILLECPNINSFDIIQDFIESYECDFQTPVIYYQAFAEESALQFMDTLGEELAAKLGNPQLKKAKSFLDIIEDSGLKMIIIDDCHLHPQATLDQLLKVFADCNVAVILVGKQENIAPSQILDRPTIRHWDRFQASWEKVS